MYVLNKQVTILAIFTLKSINQQKKKKIFNYFTF